MNKIKELKIKNFTCFENLEFKFNNINVFIGENGVGKTHLLKVLFSHIKSISDIKKDSSDESFSTELQEKIEDVFFGGNIKNLNRNNKHFEIEVVTENGIIKSKCGQKNSLKNNELKAELQQKDSKFNVIYIPAQEILSTYTNYLNYSEIAKYKLDSTYFYLANSLSKKENKVYSLSSFYKGFNKILKGEIINTNEGYSFQKEKNTFQSSLVGDGIKKLGTYKLLLENKEINKDTILFIDEPEVHLNPKLINFFVSFIIELSEKGVQIFLSSHNYLLIYLLSLKSEYSKETPISFFSLYETNNLKVTYDFGQQLSDLENNTIVDEYESLFEIEQEYFTSKQNAND